MIHYCIIKTEHLGYFIMTKPPFFIITWHKQASIEEWWNDVLYHWLKQVDSEEWGNVCQYCEINTFELIDAFEKYWWESVNAFSHFPPEYWKTAQTAGFKEKA